MSRPTRANRTSVATAADVVMTPPHIAEKVIRLLFPTGICLDPCRGDGAFYNAFPEPKMWCEIAEGEDFFDFTARVDWIITNPPYSIYDKFLEKCFSVSDNVAMLVPIAKAFKSMKIERMVDAYGGLRKIILLGGGGSCGFAFGFPVGVLWYQRGYKGPIFKDVECGGRP